MRCLGVSLAAARATRRFALACGAVRWHAPMRCMVPGVERYACATLRAPSTRCGGRCMRAACRHSACTLRYGATTWQAGTLAQRVGRQVAPMPARRASRSHAPPHACRQRARLRGAHLAPLHPGAAAAAGMGGCMLRVRVRGMPTTVASRRVAWRTAGGPCVARHPSAQRCSRYAGRHVDECATCGHAASACLRARGVARGMAPARG